MKPIALTIGEPAGIGPDIILQLAQKKPELFSSEKISIIGNKQLLQARARQLNLTLDIDQLSLLNLPLAEKVIPGELNPDNAKFIINMLDTATEYALQKKSRRCCHGPYS